MTPLTAEAGSFSSRFCGLKGKPCPENVGRAHHVGVAGVRASDAAEAGLADAIGRYTVPTLGAGSGGIARVDCHDNATGAFSLAREHGQEHPPSRIKDSSVQPGLGPHPLPLDLDCPGRRAGHVSDAQVLADDQVIAAHQPDGDLMGVVEPLASNLSVESRNAPACLAATVAAAILADKVSLGLSNLICRLREVTGIGDVLAVGGCHQVRYAHVEPYSRTGRRERVRGNIVAGQDQIPAAPVTVRWPRHRVEPTRALESGIAGRTAVAKAAEERGHRLVQPAQGSLLGGERPAALPGRIPAADVLQLGGLLAVPDDDPAHPVGGASMLKRRVVELPVVFHARSQRGGLLSSGSQEKFVRSPHSTSSMGQNQRVAATAPSRMAPRHFRRHPIFFSMVRKAPDVRPSSLSDPTPSLSSSRESDQWRHCCSRLTVPARRTRMEFKRNARIQAPLSDVWALVDDVPTVAGCIPGVHDLDMRGEREFDCGSATSSRAAASRSRARARTARSAPASRRTSSSGSRRKTKRPRSTSWPTSR